ncbi:MAG: hypothetical protein Fur0041_04970 [Bacteroidia bacterium]
MITIIAGTNRPGSKTLKIAKYVSALLSDWGVPNRVFSLEELPDDFTHTYFQESQTPHFKALLDTYIKTSNKIIAVVPEYNGSFAGIFKLLIDAIHPNDLKNKKIALIGVGAGRAGNLRGIDQLTNAFHYLKMIVYPYHLPISMVDQHLDENGQPDEVTINALKNQLKGFTEF